PVTPDGVKTSDSDKKVSRTWVQKHLDVGIEAMTELGIKGEKIKHFSY
ncbi:MAG: AMP nucleosidase, partial [Candidatus Azotimanducaceae bacterium]